MKFKKYGRIWYTSRNEAMDERDNGDRLYYDAGMEAYYIIKTKKRSFWGF